MEDLRSARTVSQAEAVRTGQADLQHELPWVEHHLAEHIPAGWKGEASKVSKASVELLPLSKTRVMCSQPWANCR